MSDDKIIPFPKPKKDRVESCEAPTWPFVTISSYTIDDTKLEADQLLKILNDLFGKTQTEMELEDLFWQIKQEIACHPESAEFVIESLKRLVKTFSK